MAARLQSAWYRIRYSFWFLPTVMVIAAVGVALGSIRIDRAIGEGGGSAYWIYGGSADGARQMLATIAGSMITVAGLVFSITIATLALASQQFGPRLLRTFMRDRGNQFVLGTFIATFVYCLLVLRQVRGGDEAFVPGVSIGIAIGLALLSIGVLIYFIHHVASYIQANSIIASVADDLEHAVKRVFPQALGHGASDGATEADAELAERVKRSGEAIVSDTSGYVEAIEDEGLMKLAVECDAVIELQKRPGHYVVADAEFARALPAERVDDAFRKRLNRSLLLGNTRTVEQDVEFAIEQLAEVAVRALSPGVNDPFTAMVCVDRLTSAMVRLMERRMPSRYRYDGEGRLRVIAPAIEFDGVMDAAFNPIRQYSTGQVPVTIRLLESMATLMERAASDTHRNAISRHTEMIVAGARESVSEPHDRADVEERYTRVLELAATAVA